GGGGGSSGGGGVSVRSGGYNNTTTDIHQGGYTNTNINTVGPEQIAENQKDRDLRIQQFQDTYGLNKYEAEQRVRQQDEALAEQQRQANMSDAQRTADREQRIWEFQTQYGLNRYQAEEQVRAQDADRAERIREFDASMTDRSADRTWQSGEAVASRRFQAGESAANRKLQGQTNAGSLAARLSELMDARTNNIIQNLSNPSDIVAREYSTRGLNAPPGTATPMYGDNAMLSNIIRSLSAADFGGGDAGGGGIQAPEASTPSTSPQAPPATLTSDSRSAPDIASPPVQPPANITFEGGPRVSPKAPESTYVAPSPAPPAPPSVPAPEPAPEPAPPPPAPTPTTPTTASGGGSGSLSSAFTPSVMQTAMNYAYRGDNPNTSAIEHDYGTQNFDPTGPTYQVTGIKDMAGAVYDGTKWTIPGMSESEQQSALALAQSTKGPYSGNITVKNGGPGPGFNTISEPQPTNPAPLSTLKIAGGLPTNTTPLGPSTNPTSPLDPSGFHAGDPNYRYDPATGTYIHMAYGGMTR
ncbi:MAG TPA: hypothetical protein VIY48_13505, partial [Candidatus Paceibacterota bacterium]